MTGQAPTRLDRATDREAVVIRAALARRCPDCGTPPDMWCFRVMGEWTVHGARILGTTG